MSGNKSYKAQKRDPPKTWDPSQCNHNNLGKQWSKETWSGQGQHQTVTRNYYKTCSGCGFHVWIKSQQVK